MLVGIGAEFFTARDAGEWRECRSAQFCLTAAIYERYLFGFSFDRRDWSAAICCFFRRKFSGLIASPAIRNINHLVCHPLNLKPFRERVLSCELRVPS